VKDRADGRKIGLLVVLIVALAVVAAVRLRPALLPGAAGAQGAMPSVGTYKVPTLEVGEDRTSVGRVAAQRNLFTFGPPPTPTPDPRPTPKPAPTLPPRPVPPPTPAGVLLSDGRRLAPPPRFTLPYLGWLGPDRLPVAIFRDGDDVIAVPVGDTLKDTFILKAVGPVDVTFGFVGYPPEITTKVALSK